MTVSSDDSSDNRRNAAKGCAEAAPEMADVAVLRDTDLARLFGGLKSFFPLTLAVSGGPDSMALMHLVARWLRLEDVERPPGTDQAAIATTATTITTTTASAAAVAVVTVDHGLRPESAAEAALVGREAAALGFHHETLPWRGDKPETGIQAAARAARYRLIASFHRRHWQRGTVGDVAAADGQGGNCDRSAGIGIESAGNKSTGAIVTAHHLDDQAETLLMRLARGSGIDGLAGMSPVTAVHGVPLLRPLLGVPKSQLQAELAAVGCQAADDASNANSDFERVRLRQAAAGLEVAGLNNEMLALSAARAARARAALDWAAAEVAVQAETQIHDLGYAELRLSALQNAPEELQLRVVGRLIEIVGGHCGHETQRPPIALSKLEALLKRLAVAEAQSGAFPGATLAGCWIGLAGGKLLVFRELGRNRLPSVTIVPGETAIWDGRFRVQIDDRVKQLVRIEALGAADATAADGNSSIWSQLKSSYSALADANIPHRAALTLPGFWLGNQFLAAPTLAGFEASLAGPLDDGAPLLQAEFLQPGHGIGAVLA